MKSQTISNEDSPCLPLLPGRADPRRRRPGASHRPVQRGGGPDRSRPRCGPGQFPRQKGKDGRHPAECRRAKTGAGRHLDSQCQPVRGHRNRTDRQADRPADNGGDGRCRGHFSLEAAPGAFYSNRLRRGRRRGAHRHRAASPAGRARCKGGGDRAGHRPP